MASGLCTCVCACTFFFLFFFFFFFFFAFSPRPLYCAPFSGDLNCVVTAGKNSKSSKVTLKVVTKLTALLSPPTVMVTSGSNVSLTCARLAGYKVEWQAVLYRIDTGNVLQQGQSPFVVFCSFVFKKSKAKLPDMVILLSTVYSVLPGVSSFFLRCNIFGMHVITIDLWLTGLKAPTN